jgi:uncharacterized Zn finger protein
VSVGERQARAEKTLEKLRNKGVPIDPVRLDGKTIARTFWGKAWCDNLERYSDFSNRLPRGRSYVRNGSVVDLQIGPGTVTARVAGTRLYDVRVDIDPLPRDRWAAIRDECTGAIGSLVELLQGKLSRAVMEVITRPGAGLFPSPAEIRMSCSCPDWAVLCKHVAAALYGAGARLDDRPELLFLLRGVDHLELVASAAAEDALAPPTTAPTIQGADLGDLFGIDLDTSGPPPAPATPKPRRKTPAEPIARDETLAPVIRLHPGGLPKRPAKGAARVGKELDEIALRRAEAKAKKLERLVERAKAAAAGLTALPKTPPRATAPTPPAPAETPRRPPSAKVRAARVAQGRYLGLLRTVRPESERERVREIARREGLPAAIAEMERLRAAPPERRKPKVAEPKAAKPKADGTAPATSAPAKARRPKRAASSTAGRLARLLRKLVQPMQQLGVKLIQLELGRAAAIAEAERILGIGKPARKATKANPRSSST